MLCKFRTMGVMSCSRKGCKNKMCDTYVNNVGYVCRECQSEFKECFLSEGKADLTGVEIKRELETFMSTTKDSYMQEDKMDNIDYFFKQHNR